MYSVMPNERDLTPSDADAFRVLEERLTFLPASSITELREILALPLAEGFQEFGRSGPVFDTNAGAKAKPPARRNSLRVHRDGRWQWLFPQGTG